MRRRWLALWVLCALHCTPSGSSPADGGADLGAEGALEVLINLPGLQPSVATLRVTARVADRALINAQEFVPRTPLTLTLPRGSQGELTISIVGEDRNRCSVLNGEVKRALSGAEREALQLTLALTTLPQRLCVLELEQVGAGAVRSSPAGLALTKEGVQQFAFPYGTKVQLTPEPGGEISAMRWEGANCTGAVPCTFDLTQRTRVTASFYPPLCSRSAGASWCWVTPLPFGDDIVGGFGGSAQSLWALGDGGMVLHYTGRLWQSEPAAPVGSRLRAIWAAGTTTWVVGEKGRAAQHDGRVFSEVPTGTAEDLNAVWGSGPSDVWAVGNSGTCLRFDGSRFRAMDTPVSNLPLYGAWGMSARDVWFVGGEDVILHWTGSSFDLTPVNGDLTTLRAVWGAGSREVWFSGGGGRLYRFDGDVVRLVYVGTGEATPNITSLGGTGGTLWGVSQPPDGSAPSILRWSGSAWVPGSALPATQLVAAGEELWALGPGVMARYTNGAWQALQNERPRAVEGLWGSGAAPSSELWAVTASEVLRRAPGSAGGFQPVLAEGGAAVSGGGPADVWVAGAQKLLRYDGASWQRLPGPDAVGLWARGPDQAWVTDRQGRVHRLVGGALVQQATAMGNAVWQNAAGEVYAAGSRLYRFDGASWTQVAGVTLPGPAALWGSGPGDLLVVSGPDALRVSGVTSQRLTVPGLVAPLLRAVWGSGPGAVFAGGELGAVAPLAGAAPGHGPPTLARINSLWSQGPQEIWAGTSRGVLRFR